MANVKDVRNFAPIVVELGGRERVINFDLNAFAELEQRFGSVNAAMEAMQTGAMKSIRVILWAGLIHEEAELDPVTGEPIRYNITPYQVGSWVKPYMMPDVSEKIMKAIGEGMPDIENMPEVQQELQKLNLPGAPKVATVVMTDEEKAQQEAKNV